MQRMITETMLPSSISVQPLGKNRARVSMGPLERGFGHTLGHAVRRVLLSSIPGYAVVEAQIEGALHEYTALDGVLEDVVDILLNLKGIRIRAHGNMDELTLRLVKDKAGPILAGDIQAEHNVEIVNPEHVIAHLTKDRPFSLTIRISNATLTIN
ncbi:MAG: DNA-directed RNA polymerase subunit alpha, partial [Pseudomonadota bacterium]